MYTHMNKMLLLNGCPSWIKGLILGHAWILILASFISHVFSCRCKDFQPAYGHLHEIRALVPSGVPYLACTATLTRSIREEVTQSLNMVDYEYVYTSPDRPNIFYEVHQRSDIETDMKPVLSSLRDHQNRAPRVIIYCRTMHMCADLYAHFHFELGDSSYYPSGTQQISDNCLACSTLVLLSTTKKLSWKV